MKRSDLIANRLREIFLNGYWIANTNYKDQLENIRWEQAIHQIEDLNTIAALTYHINYYLSGILNVFNGGLLEIKDQYSFDLPPIHSEADWEKLVKEFLANSTAFANEVAQMPDEKLDQVFVNEKYGTYLRNIEAVIEHSYYHFGQIVLIKKLILAARK
ncbi:putative damage-inducible protein DinB [Pedobacter sp. AK013]|uniref:DinB family protein n=1 Tax=Pedobacter sp. AK013 TaxID=2723071 RepID=UPI001611BA17|nr:DinB family protein [Pedobacter sp. AK013]MBB6235684.1 putative damage-inducible protein DinB [Pedobacter sp. AK013]